MNTNILIGDGNRLIYNSCSHYINSCQVSWKLFRHISLNNPKYFTGHTVLSGLLKKVSIPVTQNACFSTHNYFSEVDNTIECNLHDMTSSSIIVKAKKYYIVTLCWILLPGYYVENVFLSSCEQDCHELQEHYVHAYNIQYRHEHRISHLVSKTSALVSQTSSLIKINQKSHGNYDHIGTVDQIATMTRKANGCNCLVDVAYFRWPGVRGFVNNILHYILTQAF